MAANKRVPYFHNYDEAKQYALELANRRCTTRYVGLAGVSRWAVGTNKQLTDLGLAPLVAVEATRKLRMKQEQQDQLYTYWRQNGDVQKTAAKFGCCVSNVYRIIRERRKSK